MTIDERATKTVVAGCRILCGLLWLQNVGWKTPPDFGGVANFVNEGIEHPVLPPFSWVLENVIEPNVTLFGWGVLFLEATLAATLLLGLATRLFALVGAVQALTIGLTVAYAPNEWGWSYWMMVAAHLLLFACAAGRTFGLDGLLRPTFVEMRGRVGGVLRWAS
jgi:thiosulfate dehydrogenase (quinone) large subunit